MSVDLAALERVRAMAERWTTLKGDKLGVALDRRIGEAVLSTIRDDGTTAGSRLQRVRLLAEGWLTPGNLLHYPAAGQCVLDALADDSAGQSGLLLLVQRARNRAAEAAKDAAECIGLGRTDDARSLLAEASRELDLADRRAGEAAAR